MFCDSVLCSRGAGVSLSFEVGGLVVEWFTVKSPESHVARNQSHVARNSVMSPENHGHVARNLRKKILNQRATFVTRGYVSYRNSLKLAS